MAMIPYMAAGYAADRLMGGNGMTGLALGTGVGAVGGFGALGSALGGTTAAGANSLGAGAGLMGGTGTTVGGSALGIGSSIPATAGGYSSLLGGETILQPYNVGMGGVESTLGAYNPAQFSAERAVQGSAAGLYPDYTPIPIGGYVPSATELETAANLKLIGGLTDSVPEPTLFERGSDYMSGLFDDVTGKDVTSGAMQVSNMVDQRQQAQNMIQPPAPQIQRGKEPTNAAPLAINVPAPNREYVNARTFGLGEQPDIQIEDLLNRRRGR
jgi:hypothetical protein